MSDAQDEERARMERLVSGLATIYRRQFLTMIRDIAEEIDFQDLEFGIVGQAVEEIFGSRHEKFADLILAGMQDSAQKAAEYLTSRVGVTISFDITNEFAVQAMRENRLRLIRGLNRQQTDAIQTILTEGLARGTNPVKLAADIEKLIGLTAKQSDAVLNYRRLLETGSRDALDRKLRDRRFDRTVERAIETGAPLTEKQIDRMVSRYAERYLRYRATNIARTEALRSTHVGADMVYQQAILEGKLQSDELTRKWYTSEDERVRGSHDPMHEQQRFVGEPFTSGRGNSLMYPGDAAAPGYETIQCRCVVSTVFTQDA